MLKIPSVKFALKMTNVGKYWWVEGLVTPPPPPLLDWASHTIEAEPHSLHSLRHLYVCISIKRLTPYVTVALRNKQRQVRQNL